MIMKMLILFSSFFCFLGVADSSLPVLDQKTESLAVLNTVQTTESQVDTLLNKSSSTMSVSNSRFLEFGLEYPINFGMHLRYLVNENIYARFGFGFMPGFFLDSFEKLSPSFGYLNEEEAALISKTFENSMYLDFRLAWSPYLKKAGGGPYLELGLSGMLYGKGELKGTDLNKVIANDSFDESKDYSAKTNTYNATVHVGYQIPFEKIKLNVEVGLIKILDSKVLSETSTRAPTALDDSQKESFKKFLKKKGWIFPTVSGWISFPF